MSPHPRVLLLGLATVVTCLTFGCSDEGGGPAPWATTATTSSGTTTTPQTTSTTSGSGGAGAEGGAGGGSAGHGGAGGGGGSACRPVTVGDLAIDDTEPGGSSLAYDMNGLDAAHEHYVFVEFFDVAGAQVEGTYELGVPPDDNYSSCAHCLIAFENFDEATPIAYFAESGRMVVTTPDTAYTGASAGSLENVRLVEVTIEGSTTTEVDGGRCLLLEGSWDHTQ